MKSPKCPQEIGGSQGALALAIAAAGLATTRSAAHPLAATTGVLEKKQLPCFTMVYSLVNKHSY